MSSGAPHDVSNPQAFNRLLAAPIRKLWSHHTTQKTTQQWLPQHSVVPMLRNSFSVGQHDTGKAGG